MPLPSIGALPPVCDLDIVANKIRSCSDWPWPRSLLHLHSANPADDVDTRAVLWDPSDVVRVQDASAYLVFYTIVILFDALQGMCL